MSVTCAQHSPISPSTSANFRTHDSTPETLMPEGNKSRVSGVGVESKRPATNSLGISVDSNRVDCLVEKSGLGPKPHPYRIPGDLGVFRDGSQVRAWSLGSMVWKSSAIPQSVINSCGTNERRYAPTRIVEPGYQSHVSGSLRSSS